MAGAGAYARGEGLLMNQSSFEGASEASHHGVVVAVAPAAHAGNDIGLGEPLLRKISKVRTDRF